MSSREYYVYYHRFHNDTYYIGKGNKKRKHSDVSRSKEWQKLAQQPYQVGVYLDNLTEEEAHEVEQYLISNPLDWVLINKARSVHRVPLDVERLSELLYYSPDSPSGLRWKVSRSVVKEHGIAGTFNPKISYYQVKVDSRLLYAHRIIWTLFNGDPGSLVINHIDHNRTNNTISNLEAVTYSVNSTK